jgi:ankyrin repeat protein
MSMVDFEKHFNKPFLNIMAYDGILIDESGNTPLHYACIVKSHLTCLFILLNKYNNIQNKLGDTPLHILCSIGSIEIIKKILNYYININILNNNGEYPVDLAIINNHNDIVELLIQKFNLHIDLKYVNTVKQIKYLSKLDENFDIKELNKIFK